MVIFSVLFNYDDLSIEGQEDIPVTLNNDQFNQLKKKKYCEVFAEHTGDTPYNSCPITRDQFSDETTVVILWCGHYFSEEGIKRWLTTESTKCPCCNADVRDTLSGSQLPSQPQPQPPSH
jgi:hypothetical protein